MSVGSQEFKVTPGTTISHSTFLHRDLNDGSYFETGVLELPGGRKIGGQATQAIYEITVLEEYAKLNDLTGTIAGASGIWAKVGDLSLADPVEGTYVWTHQEEECPRTLVQLYRGPIKVEHCQNRCVSDFQSVHHLPSKWRGPLALGRVLEPTFPADHQPGQVGQRSCD